MIGALLALFYAIFDPIRVFFITNHVTKRYNVEESALYQWVRRHTLARLPWNRSRHGAVDMGAMRGWNERKEELTKLERWLAQPPETFMLMTGPRGCGKTDIVEEAIREKKYRLVINCTELIHARSDNELLDMLSKQVGFFPALSSFVNLSNMAEGLVAATTGQKAGLSSTAETQLKKILECTAIALHNLSRPRESTIGDKKEGTKEDRERYRNSTEIPVVIIDDYDVRDLRGTKQQLWDQLAQWASLLVENHIAHVVFITSTVTAIKPLSRALPKKTVDVIAIADASPATAVRFLRHQLHIDDKQELPGLAEAIYTLGGRATDLELFLQKLRAGLDPREAIDDLIDRAVVEVRKHAFGDETEEERKIAWTPVQFWAVAEMLAKSDMVTYDAVRYSSLFGGDEKPIQNMEAAELIQVIHKNGRPFFVRPSRPLYRAAFQRLLSDQKLAASMRLLTNKQLLEGSNTALDKTEKELGELSRLSLKGSRFWSGEVHEIQARIYYLLNKMKALQGVIESQEKEISTAKKVLGV